jgi:hypothetical protein
MDITILVTDRELNVVGDPIDKWVSLDVTLKHNEPASGTLVVPAVPAVTDLLQGGHRVVVVREGQIFCAGPMERPDELQWSLGGQDAEPGTVTVVFSDDLATVMARNTYPVPSAASTAQTAAAQWTATNVNAETVIRTLVDVNAGPLALPTRRIPRLALDGIAGVGTNISEATRFEPLGDVLRRAAVAGGGIAFRTRQLDDQILFGVIPSNDLTGSVRFSAGLGNLRSVTYQPEAPRANVAIVGGQGEGTARTIRERVDQDSVDRWGRLEIFVDRRDTNDTAILDQAGDEALAENAETARLATVTIDLPDQKYGVHYQLNDLVSVEVRPGLLVNDLVRAVHLTASPPSGDLVTALVGSQAATTDRETVRQLRALSRRITRMEVR